MLCTACTAKPQIVYKTEFVTVEVPVHCKIDKPLRPRITSKDSLPTYLLKVLEYTKTLEVIIDECNKE